MAARRSVRARHRPKPVKPGSGFLGQLLDPIDRLSETIYSVLILLTFTLAFRIFNLGRDPGYLVSPEYVNDLLLGAFGAILAWGIIDGIMYLLTEVFERGERHRLLWHIQTAQTRRQRVEAIAEEFDYILEPITGESQREALYQDILDHLYESEPRPARLKREDFTGALACLVVAIVSVLPSLLPFIFLRHNYALAIRASNVISFIVLFYTGYEWGRYTGSNPLRTGLLLVGVGMLLVAVAIPLGG